MRALDRLGIEARLGQREMQHAEGVIAILRERAKRSAELIATGGEVHLDGVALELLVERIAVECARALVEQIGNHVGDTGFVRRILLRPAAKRELHGDQRRGRLAHQPGLDARRAHDALDRGGGRRSRRREGEQQSRERQRT